MISSLNMLLRFSLSQLRKLEEQYSVGQLWPCLRRQICMYPQYFDTSSGISVRLQASGCSCVLPLSFCLAQYSLFCCSICSQLGSITYIIIKPTHSYPFHHQLYPYLQCNLAFPIFIIIPQMKSADYGAKLTAVTIFLICGTISTFAYKLMSTQYVDQGQHHKKFFHPYMQSFTMFVGEALFIVLYLSNRKKYELPLEPGKTPHKFYYFLIPALSDTCSSVLQYMGLNFISGSTYLMFKGASIVTTALFSKLLFGMVIQKRHIVGCGAAVAGLIVVGASGFINQSGSSSDMSNEVLGYVLMLISLIFNGFLYAYEQLLMRRHSINPIQMVGCQGCFGLVFITFIALSLSLTPCGMGDKLCVFDTFNNPYFQRIDRFFAQVGTDWVLALLVVVGISTISAYNINGVRITKLFDALTRSLLNITKTAVIWLVGIVITFSVGDNPDYQLESKDLLVNLVKGLGFLFIVVGTLTYNQLILKKYLQDRPTQESPTSQASLLSVNEQQAK